MGCPTILAFAPLYSATNHGELLGAVRAEDERALDVSRAAGAGDERDHTRIIRGVFPTQQLEGVRQIAQELLAPGEDHVMRRQHGQRPPARARLVPVTGIKRGLPATGQSLGIVNPVAGALQDLHHADADAGIQQIHEARNEEADGHGSRPPRRDGSAQERLVQAAVHRDDLAGGLARRLADSRKYASAWSAGVIGAAGQGAVGVELRELRRQRLGGFVFPDRGCWYLARLSR